MDHWSDYVIFALFLLVSLSIGVYHACTGGKQRTPEEFILGNRQLKLIPTTISLVVSYTSAITVVGLGAEVYYGGTVGWPGFVLTFVLSLTIMERFFVPWLYTLKLTSVFKVFEMRFRSRVLRGYAAILSALSFTLYIGTSTLACSIALETATGFPVKFSIPAMIGICSLYTALGGLLAVIWTDVFQCAIFIGGILAVLIKAWMSIGFGRALQYIVEEHRFSKESFLTADVTVRHTLAGFIFGLVPYTIMAHGINQVSYQRFGAMTTLQNARSSTIIKMVVMVVIMCMVFVSSILIFGYYAEQRCDPVLSGQIHGTNEIVPLFVKTVFAGQHGFSGFFLATLYSGGLSSVSSSLSSAAAVIWDDILKRPFAKLAPYKIMLINKGLVVLFGIFGTIVTFVISNLQGTILQIMLKLEALIWGPMLGLFLLAGIKGFRWVNAKGCLIGSNTAILLMLWLTIGGLSTPKSRPMPLLPVDGCDPSLNITAPTSSPLPERTPLQSLYSVSYLWSALISSVCTMIVSCVASLIINRVCRNANPDPHPDYIYIDWRDALRWDKKVQTSSSPQEQEEFKTSTDI